jgi:class III poly(R)-hydroxyalkanoic acid synthase PhaE subunit
MNWTEQAESMIQSMTEAQKKTWEGWYELARKGSESSPFSPTDAMDPMRFFKQGVEAWTAQSGDTGQGMADQIFSGQRSMLRTLELLTKSWQIVAPNLASGKSWHEQLQKFTDQWTEQTLGTPSRGLETTANIQELWQSFIAEWGPLLKPWLSSTNQLAHGHLGESLLGGSSGLNRFLNLEMDGLSRMFSMEADRELAFERLSEIPRIGSNREQTAKLLNSFDAFVDMQKTTTLYRAKLAEAMGKATERTMETLAKMAEEGKTINTVRELNRLWLDVADRVFTETYASEDYIKLQQEVSRTSLNYRIEQQKVIEMILEAMHIPTRSELDDAYRTIYELRKELKMLTKRVETLASKPAPRAATKKRKAAPRRRSATTTKKAAAKVMNASKASL